MNPDVIVVGAGPAGATAARTLARGGARTLIVERHRFPRDKACGGAISMRVVRRFPYLATALTRIPTHRISRLRLESPGGAVVTLESDEPAALMIRRVEFDHLLVQLAQEAGAELAPGIHITQATESAGGIELTARGGRRFGSPVVIAADGVNSVVARRLRFNQGWSPFAVALDMMEETSVERLRSADPGALWVSYGHRGHGYAYIFPKREHVNVGLGYLLSDYRTRRLEPPYTLQRGLIATLRERGLLDGASTPQNFTPFLIPVGGPLAETARGRVLLAGDAGGFVNGFSAEGIYYAMVSGELAARAVLDGDRGSPRGGPRQPSRLPLASAYVRAWRREIGAELRDSVDVQRFLFRDPRRIDRMVESARAHPAVADRIVRYALGEGSYFEARRRLLWRFPLLGAKLAVLRALGTPVAPATPQLDR